MRARAVLGLLVVLAVLAVGCSGPALGPTSPTTRDPPAAAALLEEPSPRQPSPGPAPLLSPGQPVDWWFAFKFNAGTFSGCDAPKACPFGGAVQTYRSGDGEEFAVASSLAPTLDMSTSCIGGGDADPLGATFGQVYRGHAFYVLYNDQFYRDPAIRGCGDSCPSPWAHAKGMVAWGPAGDGFVLQVTTPSWPASGSRAHPRRTDGNTLGCVTDDNVLVSQHFFALRLNHPDLVAVLGALANAGVVTDTTNPQIVLAGGPADVQALVAGLGQKSKSREVTRDTLSSGVTVLSKPPALHVPPWQMVSALLGGASLRTATWWEGRSALPSTTSRTPVDCWDASLGRPGAVEIATTGTWRGHPIGLTGGLGKDHHHGKLGVVTDAGSSAVIFGDMNQEGSLSGDCGAAQNGRGGLFFVLSNASLHASLSRLLEGQSAPQ